VNRLKAMLGSHCSIAGGMANALRIARRLRMDCLQVFTANQRQWNPRPPDPAQQHEWLAELRDIGWDFLHDQGPARVVSHNSYLINLASPNPDVSRRSINAMRAEVERCEAMHIPLVVTHPGAHLGEPRDPKACNDLSGAIGKDERAGLRRITRALDQLHRDLPGYRTITCLESTVGSGTNLGYCFHQLAMIRDAARQPERIGFCFDTCHVTAAGYDMSTPQGAAEVMQRWDDICGLANLRAFHFNDSIGALGSRRDRHAHIGQGCCGRACFRYLLNYPALADVPKILETPKDRDARGRDWDAVNLQALRRMRGRRGTYRVGSGIADNIWRSGMRSGSLALPATA
jgi:deoxyribonuclease IV